MVQGEYDRMGLVPCIAVSMGYILLVLFLDLLLLNTILYCVFRMGLVPCIAVSTGYILLVRFLALLLLNTILCV